jgi:hypothetical protein
MRPVASHPREAKLAELLVLQGRLEEAEAILGDDDNAETSLAMSRDMLRGMKRRAERLDGLDHDQTRSVLAAPAAVPVSMAFVFRWPPNGSRNRPVQHQLHDLLAGLVTGFPILIISPRRTVRLTQGRRSSVVEAMLLILPVAGAVGIKPRSVDR